MPRERRPIDRPLDDEGHDEQDRDDHGFHDPDPVVEDYQDHDENVERDTDDIQ